MGVKYMDRDPILKGEKLNDKEVALCAIQALFEQSKILDEFQQLPNPGSQIKNTVILVLFAIEKGATAEEIREIFSTNSSTPTQT